MFFLPLVPEQMNKVEVKDRVVGDRQGNSQIIITVSMASGRMWKTVKSEKERESGRGLSNNTHT